MASVSTASCNRTRALLSRELDDALSVLERKAVDAHVGRCASCRSFGEDARWLTEQLRAAPLLELPAPIAVAGRRRGRHAGRVVTNAAAAAAAAALAFGGFELSTSRSIETGELGFLAGEIIDAPLDDASIRALRRDALSAGEIAVLPESITGPALKPALLVTG